MFKRSWFERYGLYDTSFRIAGDYEMLLRGWPHEEAMHLPNLVTVAVGARGVSNISSAAFASLRELRTAQAMHSVRPSMVSWCRTYLHTVIRFALQRAWSETAIWKIKGAWVRVLTMGSRKS
jgi:hypothetical protein